LVSLNRQKRKVKTKPSGVVVEFAADIEAEHAVPRMSELVSVKGTDLVGSFPRSSI
jgi:hypothetical protein